MRKADIYFNGQIVIRVSFSRINSDYDRETIALYNLGEIGDKIEIIALIPKTHLIVIIND